MSVFYVTIGAQYTHRDLHPVLDMTANDIIVIEAPNELAARALLMDALGPEHRHKWSFIYPEWDMPQEKLKRYHTGRILTLKEAVRAHSDR